LNSKYVGFVSHILFGRLEIFRPTFLYEVLSVNGQCKNVWKYNTNVKFLFSSVLHGKWYDSFHHRYGALRPRVRRVRGAFCLEHWYFGFECLWRTCMCVHISVVIMGLCLKVQYRSLIQMSVDNIKSNCWHPMVCNWRYDSQRPRYSNCTRRHPRKEYQAPYKIRITLQPITATPSTR